MDTITFDTSIDLADRIGNVEKAIGEIVAAINALPAPSPAFDPSALTEQLDTFKTELDGISGRLEADENTLKAMADSAKLAAPDNVAAIAAEIEGIRTVVNAFHKEVYGDANPNIPFPPSSN